jgi:hypothetical protein
MAKSGAQLGNWELTFAQEVPQKSHGFVQRAIGALLSRCFLLIFGLPE